MAMAKNKYAKWLESFGLEYVRRLAEEGCPDEEIAIRSGLSLGEFRRWRKKYPDFAEAIELGKSSSDYAVVRALYRKATGYNLSLNKTYKLKRVDYDPDTGKKLREYEELATGVDETYVPGDLRAETFWLKNRQSDRWSDRPEKEDGDGDSEGGIVVIPEADMLGDE